MALDVFLSYATEDEGLAESYRERFVDLGLKVFFAPVREREAAAGSHAPDLQSSILERLRESRTVVLLWSRYADKSEWVAFETASVATLRIEGFSGIRLVVVDLKGSQTPPWLTIQATVGSYDDECLEQLITSEDWNKFSLVRDSWLARGQSPWRCRRSAALVWSILTDQVVWEAKVRRALSRLAPNFSFGHLTAPDLEGRIVKALLRDALALPLTLTLFLTMFAIAVSWIIPYPAQHVESAQQQVLSVGVAALALGALLMLRVGMAAGIAATAIAGLAGPLVALVAAWYSRHGAVANGAVAGIAIGTATAVSMSLQSGAANQAQSRPSLTPLFAGLPTAATALFALRWLATWMGQQYENPTMPQRAWIGFCFGSAFGLVVATLPAQIALYQRRRRFWREAARLGALLLASCIGLTVAAATAVPFRQPNAIRDGIGIGLLVAISAGGSVSLLHHFFARPLGERRSVAVAVAAVSVLALPFLRTFGNIQSSDGYWAFVIGIAAAALATTALRRLQLRGSRKRAKHEGTDSG